MNCLINQPAGLGDIIFCQKIVDLFVNNGYNVAWPVVNEYYDTINKHMKKDGVSYCRVEDEFCLKEHYNSGITTPHRKPNGDAYLPLRYADLHYPNQSVLKAKYKILGLTYDGWQNNFLFERDIKKEKELYYDVLGLKDSAQYIFVNGNYGTPPHYKEKNIIISDSYQIVKMEIFSEFTIFDWCGVIENASQIYCVDTSLFYIIDMLDLTANRLEAYSKFVPANYIHIEHLFKKPWNYN